ncbi:hypothetical protein C5167_033765 [Papaver somniferum]|uniref:Lysosomal Pro-X carboxypeptidase n=1 Tax=Papaver somniferum TaxID=3469 RepID=A0A4Y7KE25_PAPSO|nr:hypothetical protein C5167_033765 [Papaver somniferum]
MYDHIDMKSRRGEESNIDADVAGIGFLSDNAPQFNALIVFIEHRYYGKSIPFGSREEAFRNASTLGYFNSAQALADYAEVIISLKKNMSADSSPVIVFGGSYGGSKYLNFVGQLAEISKFCYDVIKEFWSLIDSIASQENGLAILSEKFKTCSVSPLSKSSELKDCLGSIYAESAQYNAPPKYPVTVICGAIDGAPIGTDILSRIQSGVAAFMGKQNCYDMGEFTRQTETIQGWQWQDIKSVLQVFASNIIYSNGLRDPYSSGGVLENISDNVVAITTDKGSHCLDLLHKSPDDPKWLVEQREAEIEIIKRWIEEYNALRIIKTSKAHHWAR